jgi:oxygen-independent coproporphyrinogen-3 oxidase
MMSDHELLSPELKQLLLKYDRPGPRYTSYPTAPAWGDLSVTDMEAALQRYVVADDAGEAPALSLYVHIPFCEERCLFCGCNVVISPEDRVSEPYMDVLKKEIDLVTSRLGKRRRVSQLHLGGGTPTYLRPEQLQLLTNWLKDAFDFQPDAEISIEVDPVVTRPEHVHALREVGYNRISMGVQDLDPKVQQSIHRVQPEALTDSFYTLCRELEFDSVNMDLIYGLPYQKVDQFARTVQRLVEWGPDRVAVFNYAHVPWIKPHQKQLPTDQLPSPDMKLAMILETGRIFTAGGYEAIGLDHFAKPEDELAEARRKEILRRNFMGYTTQPETESIAFGVTGISEIMGIYAQNLTRLSKYEKCVSDGSLTTHKGLKLSDDDIVRNEVIMDLMCNLVIDKPRIERRFGIAFDDYFADALPGLSQMQDDGLVELSDAKIRMVGHGPILVRNAAMLFDAYLPKDEEDTQNLFSRTV